jgi:FAD/FMN-containing dehydrogenase
MPDEMNIFAAGPRVDVREGEEPSPDDPVVVGISLVWQGAAEDAAAAIEPLRDVLALSGARGAFEPVSYLALQAGNGVMSFGYRNYWKGHFLRDLDELAIEAIATAMETVPESMSFILLEGINGRAREEPEGGAAFGQRKARWNASALGIWEDPALDEIIIDWVRRSVDAMAPSSLTGAGYGNYAPVDETAERVRAAFGDDSFARLARVKARYDPENVFRFNHNIPPAAG